MTKPPDSPDLSSFNIVDCLRHFSEIQPEHPAMEDGSRTITYAELNRRTDEAAVNLREVGVSPGDVVTIVLADGIAHLIVICGLGRLGAVQFSLGLDTSNDELRARMLEVGSRYLVAATKAVAHSDIEVLGQEEICASNGRKFGAPGGCGDQPYVLVQSSGATGKPKSFAVTHAQSWHRGKHYQRYLGLNGRDRLLCLSYMSFNICRASFLYLLGTGGTLVLSADRTPAAVVKFVNEHDISFLKLLPVNLAELLDYAGTDRLLFPKLRAMNCGSAPITPEQRRLARQRLATHFIEEFGINESGVIAFSTPGDQDRYPGSVGKLIDAAEIEIVDSEFHVLPHDTAGLVRLRCPGMIESYVDNPEMTARHFRDGWYYPGDIARVNADGYLFFLGRADDVINNAGVKFYPIEVEEVLLAYPGIIEAAVFPLPQEHAGQCAGAAVVSDRDVGYDALMDFCASQLPAFKLPRIVIFKNALPKNAMGKIIKRELSAEIQARLRSRSERNGAGEAELGN